MAALEFQDIQGFVLSSYVGKMPCASYLLIKVDADFNTCNTWLTTIAGDITTGADRKDDFNLNIAFTATGLAKLGFKKPNLITFSIPFQEGMSSPIRQTLLGDSGNSAPKNWDWGYDKGEVDILLLLFAKDETELAIQKDKLNDGIKAASGITVVTTLNAGRQPDSKEHFGFVDGIGQPVIAGTGREEKQIQRTGHATVVKPGEFILGYENEMLMPDPVPTAPNAPDFGRNGTYLVFRQLEQHVYQFWEYVRTAPGATTEDEQEKLAAKIVGRWKSGAPLTHYRDNDPVSPPATNQENNFGFAAKDAAGFGCPIGAHIRRTNPRDSLFDDPEVSLRTVKRHRIIRRGRSYGDRIEDVYIDDHKERGLHFICVNSNIERQFEFIQQSWSNNPSFSALNNETDPLIGERNAENTFSIQGCPVRHRVHNLPEFVTTKGGAYFFMPGITALQLLCK